MLTQTDENSSSIRSKTEEDDEIMRDNCAGDSSGKETQPPKNDYRLVRFWGDGREVVFVKLAIVGIHLIKSMWLAWHITPS